MSAVTSTNSPATEERPAWQRITGQGLRLFGIQYFDLVYGRLQLGEPLEIVAPGITTQARLATPADLERLPDQLEGITREQRDRYLQLGSRCYLAQDSGIVHGMLWVNPRVNQLLGQVVGPLTGHSFQVHNGVVSESYRGEKVFKYLLVSVLNDQRQAGFETMTCLIDTANQASMTLFASLGTEFVKAPIIRWPGNRLTSFSPALK